MKTGSDRKYTAEFRDSAVKQVVEGGRSMPAVARSLEMSSKTLANWVYRARKGDALVKRAPAQPSMKATVRLGVGDLGQQPAPRRHLNRSPKRGRHEAR